MRMRGSAGGLHPAVEAAWRAVGATFLINTTIILLYKGSVAPSVDIITSRASELCAAACGLRRLHMAIAMYLLHVT